MKFRLLFKSAQEIQDEILLRKYLKDIHPNYLPQEGRKFLLQSPH